MPWSFLKPVVSGLASSVLGGVTGGVQSGLESRIGNLIAGDTGPYGQGAQPLFGQATTQMAAGAQAAAIRESAGAQNASVRETREQADRHHYDNVTLQRSLAREQRLTEKYRSDMAYRA